MKTFTKKISIYVIARDLCFRPHKSFAEDFYYICLGIQSLAGTYLMLFS